jgi:glycosyltransferase involved in cell wall biosynthesis
MISVVVNTRNEEARLPLALRSVRGLADEVVVVDMESEDGTVAIAQRLGARVLRHPATGFVEPARAFACARAAGDWLLLLDADEVVPPRLARRLREIARGDEADAVQLATINWILGAPLLHAGWNPERDRHVRFFRRDAVTLPAEIHGAIRARPGARLLALPALPSLSLVHFAYADSFDFLERLNRYTEIEAAQAAARGEADRPLRVLARAAREFAVRFVWHRGYRDGWRGLYLSLLMAGYRLVAGAKRLERDRLGSRDDVVCRYRRAAEALLAEAAPDGGPK